MAIIKMKKRKKLIPFPKMIDNRVQLHYDNGRSCFRLKNRIVLQVARGIYLPNTTVLHKPKMLTRSNNRYVRTVCIEDANSVFLNNANHLSHFYIF